LPRTKQRVQVCESCTMAVQDEDRELTWKQAAALAREWGGQVADHECDAFEVGEPCGGGCRDA